AQLLPQPVQQKVAAEQLAPRRLGRWLPEVVMIDAREPLGVHVSRARHATARVKLSAERDPHRLVDKTVAWAGVKSSRRLREDRNVRNAADIERRRRTHAEDEAVKVRDERRSLAARSE